MSVRAFLFLILTTLNAHAQGFAGLETAAEGFAVPERGRSFQFPMDHGPHPAYRIEWWYLTANLTGADGRAYGVQWTLFRSAMRPRDPEGWTSPQIWMGHAGLTTPETHFVAEALARGGIGQAGVTVAPFAAWIDDWIMKSSAADRSKSLSNLLLRASGKAFAYDLELTANGPLVLHGDRGYSVKSASGQASYYYSQPFYRVTGTLALPEGEVAVEGSAWLDREWSSQPLQENQEGWDWFSLHLDGGVKLMGFRLRQADGTDYTSATWIAPDGEPEPFGDGALRLTPLDEAKIAGRQIPVRWRVELPEKGLDVTTEPLNEKTWMATAFPYWEGPIRVSGSHAGRGYLEMTGYE
ncbi:MAG: iron ABC transporter permease [Rhodobacteraceae bacterium]|nr:iron ABC transporter permease [Paracoccaceae bacterium]